MPTMIVSYIAYKFPLRCMYSEEWQKVKTKIPLSLWKKVEILGFDSPDKAVLNALEKLVSDPELNLYGKEQEIRIQELKNGIEDEQRHNQELQNRIKETENSFGDAQRCNQELQGKTQELEKRLEDEQRRSQELQSKIQEFEKQLEGEQRHSQEFQSKIQEFEKLLEDEQRHNQELQRELELRKEEAQTQITDLRKELEKAERREIYFEEMHNNYMMQVQTLINQKQIVAPGAKKSWWKFW
jgi:chromosome segregation ATPase